MVMPEKASSQLGKEVASISRRMFADSSICSRVNSEAAAVAHSLLSSLMDRVSEDIVLDIGEEGRIIGIEILDASKHVALDRLLPVKYEIEKEAV